MGENDRNLLSNLGKLDNGQLETDYVDLFNTSDAKILIVSCCRISVLRKPSLFTIRD